MANHFLCRNAATVGSSFSPRGLLAFNFFFPDAGLLQRGEQDGEQIVGEGGEMRLGLGGGFAIGPSFLLMELVFEDIENLFDLPA